MTGNTETTIRAVYAAWYDRDLDSVAKHLSEDFRHDIHIPRSVHPLGGPTSGKMAALDRFRKILDQFDFLAFDITFLITSAERAAAQVHLHYLHRASGGALETTSGHFWSLRDGLATHLEEYHHMGDVQDFTSRVIVRL